MGVSLLCLQLLAQPSMAQNSHTATAYADDHTAQTMIVVGSVGKTAGNDTLAPIGEILHEFSNATDNTKASNANTNASATTKANTAKIITSHQSEIAHDKLVLNSPVIDEARILSADEITQLSTQIRQIYDDNLAQMALVIVPTTGGVDIFDYGLQVARRWGLGRDDIDNGVLILVAVNDRKMRIFTGHGVEGVLPDAVLNRIIRDVISPNFKAGQFAQGLSAGIARIDERLRADPDTLARADQATNTQDNDEQPNLVGLLIMAVVAGGFLNMILGRFLGASVATGGFVMLALGAGIGLLTALFIAFILWLFLLIFVGRGMVVGGGFGGGGFGGGSGGFGGGGYSGGGGSFGGGGAGGSW